MDRQCPGTIQLGQPDRIIKDRMFMSAKQWGFEYDCKHCGRAIKVRATRFVEVKGKVTPHPCKDATMRCPTRL